jgi:hypothetical protein
MVVMKKLITNVTAGLLLGGIGADGTAPQRVEAAPPATPYSKKITPEPVGGVSSIQPTKEGGEIIKRLADQGDAFIKTPSKAGGMKLSQKNIDWLTAITKDIPGASVKAIDENGYHHALVMPGEDKKEDVWYIQSIGVSGPVFFGFGSWGFTFVNKDDPHMLAVHEGSAKLSTKEFLHIMQEARLGGISQKNDPAGQKKFDLTKERPIGYLCFNGFDESDKTTRTQYYEYSRALPELLKRCGYDMVCLDDKNRITEMQALPSPRAVASLVANPNLDGIVAFAATPFENNAQLVERQIAALHKQGVRDFYLNFLSHGDAKKGLLGYDDAWLHADDLKKILVKYGDCKFTIDATGCEGGGLIAMMRDFKDAPDAPEGRVAVFVHTKETLSTLSHEYQSLLIKMLADMADGVKGAPQTYGEAHYRTDLERRRLSNGRHDPEFWKSMPGQPSLRTAQNDAPKHRLPDVAERQTFAAYAPVNEWIDKIKNDEPNEPKGRG